MLIRNIPTEKFNLVLKFAQHHWQTIYSYDGMDAWIDYGEVHLSKDGSI